MTPVSLIVVGNSPWQYPSRDDVSFRYASALANQLEGSYHVVVPAEDSHDAGMEDCGQLLVHRLEATSTVAFARQAVGKVGSLLKEEPNRTVLVSSDPVGLIICAYVARNRGDIHLAQVQGEVIFPGLEYGRRPRRWLLRHVMRLGLRHASGVRTVNDYLARQAESITDAPVRSIGTRVDTDRFQPAAATVTRNHAVVVGSLLQLKNVDSLLRAWTELPAGLRSFRLDIIGDGPHRGKLEEAVERLGLVGRVCFLGRLSNEEVASVLPRYRMLLHPSLSEGQPRAVLEGLASGLPVLASDIVAHRELGIVEAKCGDLLSPDDVSEWARRVQTLAALDCDTFASLSARARAHAVARFGFHNSVEVYLRFIHDLIRRDSP